MDPLVAAHGIVGERQGQRHSPCATDDHLALPPGMPKGDAGLPRDSGRTPASTPAISPYRPSRPSSQRFSRTKTGCFTCRARRKKCDEARDPASGACGRCRNSGIECLGFPPLKSAPPAAHWRQSIAQARHGAASPAHEHVVQAVEAAQTVQPTYTLTATHALEQPQHDSGVARWADLMALDDGEQLFYEGMLGDAAIDALPTPAPTRATSADVSQEQACGMQQEDHALAVLANFYAMLVWYRWQPVRGSGYTKDQLASTLKDRLQRSEVLCISVASVAACYAFGSHVVLREGSMHRSLRKHWTSIYAVVTSTKTRNLCAFLDWLGQTSHHGGQAAAVAAVADLADPASSSSSPPADQAATLFSLASRVLEQIACAASQDQELATDQSMPLDVAALAHVDKYLHAAMDLAQVAYASRSAHAFIVQLDAASALLNSLLGQGQCVRLVDLRGLETVGVRTFVWADITNAALSGRSTFLHYLPDDGVPDESSDQARPRHPPPTADLHATFGCPDDVLVVVACIANLHFQLLHARKAGVLPGQGPESLPAWALHTALALGVRLRSSEEAAGGDEAAPSKRSSGRAEHRCLAAMWRHAAHIFLNTAAYRLGPLSSANQERLRAILRLYADADLRPMTLIMGAAAMPLLFAAFVAISREDQQACMDALQLLGQREAGRASYRRFVEGLWRRSNETGFAVLWQDMLLDGGERIAIV